MDERKRRLSPTEWCAYRLQTQKAHKRVSVHPPNGQWNYYKYHYSFTCPVAQITGIGGNICVRICGHSFSNNCETNSGSFLDSCTSVRNYLAYERVGEILFMRFWVSDFDKTWNILFVTQRCKLRLARLEPRPKGSKCEECTKMNL